WRWFEPRSEFQRLAESWTPRVPLDGDDDGIAWFGAYGRCLEPLSYHGDLKAVDPRIPAQDGDIVVVQLSVSELIEVSECWIRFPQLAYPTLSTLVTKLLCAHGGAYLMLCNAGCMPLGRS